MKSKLLTINVDRETLKVLKALSSKRNITIDEMAKSLFLDYAKESKSTSKKTGQAGSKATFKDIGGGCEAVTLTGEIGELAARVAQVSGVSPDAAVRMALKAFDDAQEGTKAVYIPTRAYRHLEQIADALNLDTWGDRDNTAQNVFNNLVLENDLEDDPAQVMEIIIEGLDYLPEKLLIPRTQKDDKIISMRKAALTSHASKIKWE